MTLPLPSHRYVAAALPGRLTRFAACGPQPLVVVFAAA
jgi:hypothetical protein